MKESIRATQFTVHKQSRVLEIVFDDGAVFSLPFEFLRVYSPSAEVRGHGTGQEVLQTGKRNVLLTALEPVGNYAVQPHFSDGHNTGIYSWDYLYSLGKNRDSLWEDYLKRLEAAGFTRESGREVLSWVREVQDRGAGEIVLNCMGSDGVRRGYDVEQLRTVREICDVPLVASGGAGAVEHFASVFKVAGVDAALAASVFHTGAITIPDLKRDLRAAGIEIRP